MDNVFGQLLIEIVICAVSSAIAVGVIFRSLQRLLDEVCGTTNRANFWVIYSAIMLFIAPLLTVLLFGKSGRAPVASFEFYKTAMVSALFGLFCALVVIGLQIVKVLPKRDEPKGGSAPGAAAYIPGNSRPPSAAVEETRDPR